MNKSEQGTRCSDYPVLVVDSTASRQVKRRAERTNRMILATKKFPEKGRRERRAYAMGRISFDQLAEA